MRHVINRAKKFLPRVARSIAASALPRSAFQVMQNVPNIGNKSSSLYSAFFMHRSSFTTQAQHVEPSEIKLPVLNALVSKAKIEQKSLEKTAIVYIHHPLQTSVNLIQSMLQLGAKPQNIFVLGKHYSECLPVVDKVKKLGVFYQPCSEQIGLGKFFHSFLRDINWLWAKVISNVGKDVENILILDHGGHALAFTPASIIEKYKVIGIEKTTAGLINPNVEGLPFPLIEVASCATKKVLESPLIANAVVDKLTPLIPIRTEKLTCGVVGYGAVGKAVVDKLTSMGHKVIVYDNDQQKLKSIKNAVPTDKLGVLTAFTDYIFGCTGRDITQDIDYFRMCNRDRTLISCSSEDKEFLSLIQLVQRRQNGKNTNKPLSDITYTTDMGATINILRGGFPINFDHSGESVPANDIQLTRALVFGGVLQAIELFKAINIKELAGNYMLDTNLQKFIANEWLKYQSPSQVSKEIIKNFQNESWIGENSGGIKLEQPLKSTLAKHSTSLSI